jgi:hypothetical protein
VVPQNVRESVSNSSNPDSDSLNFPRIGRLSQAPHIRNALLVSHCPVQFSRVHAYQMNTALSSVSLSNSTMDAPHSGQIRSVSSVSVRPATPRARWGNRGASSVARLIPFNKLILNLSFRESPGITLMYPRNPKLHRVATETAATPECAILSKSDNIPGYVQIEVSGK